jgi:hypothetical protein
VRSLRTAAAVALTIAVIVAILADAIVFLSRPAWTAQLATRGYNACLLSAAQNGTYTTTDDGTSALLLMHTCDTDRREWLNACMAHGDSNIDCVLKSALRALLTIVILEDLRTSK